MTELIDNKQYSLNASLFHKIKKLFVMLLKKIVLKNIFNFN